MLLGIILSLLSFAPTAGAEALNCQVFYSTAAPEKPLFRSCTECYKTYPNQKNLCLVRYIDRQYQCYAQGETASGGVQVVMGAKDGDPLEAQGSAVDACRKAKLRNCQLNGCGHEDAPANHACAENLYSGARCDIP